MQSGTKILRINVRYSNNTIIKLFITYLTRYSILSIILFQIVFVI